MVVRDEIESSCLDLLLMWDVEASCQKLWLAGSLDPLSWKLYPGRAKGS